jgi:hypothetical protein
MAVKLSASGAGRALPLRRFLVLNCVRSGMNLKAKMRLELFGKLKNKCNYLIEN